MLKSELVDRIEKAIDMVISVSGRRFRILRDEEDNLTIAESARKGSIKHYTDTYDLISRYRIDGKPLREYTDTIRIIKYTALLDA